MHSILESDSLTVISKLALTRKISRFFVRTSQRQEVFQEISPHTNSFLHLEEAMLSLTDWPNLINLSILTLFGLRKFHLCYLSWWKLTGATWILLEALFSFVHAWGSSPCFSL
ncbi:hypothetical protein V6N12_071178 [Hibiscus sabdariffa]|uniref:Uncharacterized protein n=1 Tax=Hibiscus sabdariffa TaxID=183260 RepID=A0ABR2FJJ4_9ROSI